MEHNSNRNSFILQLVDCLISLLVYLGHQQGKYIQPIRAGNFPRSKAPARVPARAKRRIRRRSSLDIVTDSEMRKSGLASIAWTSSPAAIHCEAVLQLAAFQRGLEIEI